MKITPSRGAARYAKIGALGFVGAVAVILLGFISYNFARPITTFVWSIGQGLVTLSDKLCPPSGVVCVFGSESQGRHHLWFFICLFVGWWVLASLISWVLAKYVVTKSGPT